MARIRSIKQDFFVNEDLATISSDARLLAIGLSTIADRSGRLEDRPARIKALLFPYHDVDVDSLLNELDQERVAFIQRYSVAGQNFIQITNFEKHQKPHPKEPESSIPENEAVKKNGEPWKKTESREKKFKDDLDENQTDESSARNGLRNGSGSGSGDLGSLDPGNGLGDSVGTGASAANENPKGGSGFTIWTLGLGKLLDVGMDNDDARSFLGKQCQEYGRDSVAEAVVKMLAQEPIDPKAYLVAVLKGQGKARHGPPCKADSSLGSVNRVIAEKLEALHGTTGS